MYNIQPVTIDNLYRYTDYKCFRMIDNYIYLYHTDTLIAIPVYPESLQDSMPANFATASPMARSAPIYSYTSSGPRSIQFQLSLHRDMMNQVNVSESRLNIPPEDLYSEDYVDILVNQLQSAALPRYAASEKMVDPPIVAVRFGNSLFCKGIVDGGVSVTHSGPILYNDKYAMLNISFNVKEIDPYDAEYVAVSGGFRGIPKTLERNIYKR